MKNEAGFINKKYKQPSYYSNIFNFYCAVYLGSDGKEYHIQLPS